MCFVDADSRALAARHGWQSTVLLLVAAALAACGGKGGGDNGNNNTCPEGHRPEGPACVPIFDDCPGPAEIPVLGGGCQPVGVTQCATGFVSDGEGGCDPILPPDPCPAGTMEVIGETECQPVGVTECATGFVSDGEGGCDAILPPGPDPCPFGTMEVLGHTECQPIGDCGTGTWGNITTDATTVFVDQSADASGADGSDASPFTTIADGLAVVEPGGQIVVAAGQYVERLVLDQPVELAGRCAELVTVVGVSSAQDEPVLTIMSGGSQVRLSGVTLTGAAGGIVVQEASAVRLSEIAVVDTGYVGIWAAGEADVLLEDSLVARATRYGVVGEGSTLEIRRSVIREGVPETDGSRGRGIGVWCPTAGSCGRFTMANSIVSGNRSMGIYIGGADVSIVSSVVRDTLSEETDGSMGLGVIAQCDAYRPVCGAVAIEQSLVQGNRQMGLIIQGLDARVYETTVRDTLPKENDEMDGIGIEVHCFSTDACGAVIVENSAVLANRTVGVNGTGVDLTVVSTIVRDTMAQQSDGMYGRGISFECQPAEQVCGRLTVVGSLVCGNRDTGIFAAGVDSDVASTVVRDTQPQDWDRRYGNGIAAHCHSGMNVCGSLSVTGSLVVGSREVGIAVFSVDATIASTVVLDTRVQESDGLVGRGINAQHDPSAAEVGTLAVNGSFVARNDELGIFAGGADLAISGTVVRETLAVQDGISSAGGVLAACYPNTGPCGTLTVANSLVEENRGLGLLGYGVEASITSSVVRNTRAKQSNGIGGEGINAQCDPIVGECGNLSVLNTLVQSSRNVGIYIIGVPAILSGVAVLDTRSKEEDPWKDDYGQGVFAKCYPTGDWCPALQITSSLVDSCYSAGLAVQGAEGFIESSAISAVLPRPLDEAFGYGIQVEGFQDSAPLLFDVRSCRIENASLAGIIYYRARGTVSRSMISGGQFSIIMNEGSAPTIASDNSLSGSVEDEPTWANIFPSPAPPPTIP